MATKLSETRICFDAFMFNSKDNDLPSFTSLTQKTGGSFYFYREYDDYL